MTCSVLRTSKTRHKLIRGWDHASGDQPGPRGGRSCIECVSPDPLTFDLKGFLPATASLTVTAVDALPPHFQTESEGFRCPTSSQWISCCAENGPCKMPGWALLGDARFQGIASLTSNNSLATDLFLSCSAGPIPTPGQAVCGQVHLPIQHGLQCPDGLLKA